jgi:hypothetical protein
MYVCTGTSSTTLVLYYISRCVICYVRGSKTSSSGSIFWCYSVTCVVFEFFPSKHQSAVNINHLVVVFQNSPILWEGQKTAYQIPQLELLADAETW